MSARPATSELTSPMFQVLLSLIGDDLHGYALIQDIEQRTNGATRLTASTLYGVLKRLLENGYIEELEGDDARRRIYRITRTGRSAARAEVDRLAALLDAARTMNLVPSPNRSR